MIPTFDSSLYGSPFSFIYLFPKVLFIYSWETHRERQRLRQREKQASCREPTRDSIPGPQGRCSTTEPPRCPRPWSFEGSRGNLPSHGCRFSRKRGPQVCVHEAMTAGTQGLQAWRGPGSDSYLQSGASAGSTQVGTVSLLGPSSPDSDPFRKSKSKREPVLCTECWISLKRVCWSANPPWRLWAVGLWGGDWV